MQLITLNIWGGKLHEKLIDFININKAKTDIFCFQEVFKSDLNDPIDSYYPNILEELKQILSEFDYKFYPTANNANPSGYVNFPLFFGQATFVKKSISILESGSIFVYKKENDFSLYPNGKPDFPRNFVYTILKHENKKFLVLNLHGYWSPEAKFDKPERIKQSEIIINFIQKQNLPVILAGDFNLRINTKSLQMFEENNLINLVKKHKPDTTRSKFYLKAFPKDLYADYILISQNIAENNFKVIKDEVSDHLPLLLEFNI